MSDKKTETGKATVQDFSNGADGSKSVDVEYVYEYEVLATQEELKEKFSPADLLTLANARIKSTANSGARQKAIAPFAQDPNSIPAIRERMIKDAMKMNKTREVAEAFVDSLLAS